MYQYTSICNMRLLYGAYNKRIGSTGPEELCLHTYLFICLFPLALQPSAGNGLLVHAVSWSHTTTCHSRCDSSGRVISSSQRPLPDNTHNRQTSMPPGGIRTLDRNRRANVDLRLRPRGHLGPAYPYLYYLKCGIKCLMKRTYSEINLNLHVCKLHVRLLLYAK
jgi:hypothetical protein